MVWRVVVAEVRWTASVALATVTFVSTDDLGADHASAAPDAVPAIVSKAQAYAQRTHGEQRAWEERTRTHPDTPWPFTRFAEFALGMTARAIYADQKAQAAVGGDPVSQEVRRPVVMLVALALYEAARRERLADIDTLPLRRAIPLLATDSAAREVAQIRPVGAADTVAGHLPDDDDRALTEVLLPEHAEQWEQWRAQAEHVLLTMYELHGGLQSSPDSSAPMLYTFLSDCRAVGVRARWIERPEVTALGADAHDGI